MTNGHKRSHFKIEPFLKGAILKTATPRSCLARLTPQNFGMSDLGKITYKLSQTNILFQTTVCKADRKADLLTTRPNDDEHSLELAPSCLAKE